MAMVSTTDTPPGKTVVVGTPYVSEFIEHADDGGSFMLRCVDNERNSFEIDGRTNRCTTFDIARDLTVICIGSVRLATSLGESKDMPSPRPGAPLAEVPPSMTALYHADKDVGGTTQSCYRESFCLLIDR